MTDAELIALFPARAVSGDYALLSEPTPHGWPAGVPFKPVLLRAVVQLDSRPAYHTGFHALDVVALPQDGAGIARLIEEAGGTLYSATTIPADCGAFREAVFAAHRHANERRAADRVQAARVAALASAALAEARDKRDRMQARAEEGTARRLKLEADADQLAGAIRAAVVEGKDDVADKLEVKLNAARTEASKLERRVPELETAAEELAQQVVSLEERASRIACHKALPEARQALSAARLKIVSAAARYAHDIAEAATGEAEAAALVDALRRGANDTSRADVSFRELAVEAVEAVQQLEAVAAGEPQ